MHLFYSFVLFFIKINVFGLEKLLDTKVIQQGKLLILWHPTFYLVAFSFSSKVNVMTTGVMPDSETEMILKNTFGKNSHPMHKFGRMMYWMPKFKVSKCIPYIRCQYKKEMSDTISRFKCS